MAFSEDLFSFWINVDLRLNCKKNAAFSNFFGRSVAFSLLGPTQTLFGLVRDEPKERLRRRLRCLSPGVLVSKS